MSDSELEKLRSIVEDNAATFSLYGELVHLRNESQVSSLNMHRLRIEGTL